MLDGAAGKAGEPDAGGTAAALAASRMLPLGAGQPAARGGEPASAVATAKAPAGRRAC